MKEGDEVVKGMNVGGAAMNVGGATMNVGGAAMNVGGAATPRQSLAAQGNEEELLLAQRLRVEEIVRGVRRDR